MAWPIAINVALADLSVHSQVEWRRTFNEQRHVWSASYSRVAWPSSLRATLFLPEHEHFDLKQPSLVA